MNYYLCKDNTILLKRNRWSKKKLIIFYFFFRRCGVAWLISSPGLLNQFLHWLRLQIEVHRGIF